MDGPFLDPPRLPTESRGAITSSSNSVAEDGNRRYPATGISYLRSKVTIAWISDGTSNTYMVGEKYLEPRLLP